MDSFINPFIKLKNQPSSLIWQHLKEKTEYHFELILPFKGVIKKFRDQETYYIHFCAEVLEDKDLNCDRILEGHLILVSFPARTLENAYSGIGYLFRNNLEEGNNIRLKFKKKSKKLMMLIECEEKEPSKRQIKFADKYYPTLVPKQRKTIIRREESF